LISGALGQKRECQKLTHLFFSGVVAVARYSQIMDDEDAWQPAYESLGEKEFVMPTKSAEKLMDLLEIVTSKLQLFG
jgi:hypothetical protein